MSILESMQKIVQQYLLHSHCSVTQRAIHCVLIEILKLLQLYWVMFWFVDLVSFNHHVTIITRRRHCLVPLLGARDGANVHSHVVETNFNTFEWISASQSQLKYWAQLEHYAYLMLLLLCFCSNLTYQMKNHLNYSCTSLKADANVSRHIKVSAR